MRPPLTYYGGKQKLAQKIIGLLPPHQIYVEPFAGGAAVLFARQRKAGRQFREVLNDRNEKIVNLYRVLQDRTLRGELMERLRFTPYAKSEHARARTLLASGSPLEQAWALVVLCNQSYASNFRDGSWRFSRGGKHDATVWSNKIDSIEQVLTRLDGVYLENDDALAIIRKWDTENTCFYCDPPYPGADQGPYSGYKQEDFEELVEALSECQASFVLSCYENPAVPDDWPCIDVPVRVWAGDNKRRAVEKLWVVNRSGESGLEYEQLQLLTEEGAA